MTTPPTAGAAAPVLGYMTLGADDLPAAVAFYDAALAPLGLSQLYAFEGWTGYGREGDPSGQTLWVCKPFDGQPAREGNGVMLGFYAPTPEVVDAFYAAAMAHGGAEFKKQVADGIIALVGVADGKAAVTVAVTGAAKDRFNAADLAKAAVIAMGGQGAGGRPDFAQGGAPDGARAEEGLAALKAAITG